MKLSSIFATTTLLAGIMAIVFWQQLRTERGRTVHLTEQLQQRAGRPEQRQGSSSLSTLTAGDALASASPASVISETPGLSTAEFVQYASANQDPEYCAGSKAMSRAWTKQEYPDVVKVLALSPQETAALFDILNWQKEPLTDMNCGSDENRKQARLDKRSGETDTRLQALLGRTKYQQWQEYLSTRPSRDKVKDLRKAIASGGAPLNDQQAELLVAGKIAEDARRMQESSSRVRPKDPRQQRDFDEETIRMLERSYERLLDSAQSYLSAEQMVAARKRIAQLISGERAMQQSLHSRLQDTGSANAVPVIGTPR